MAAEANKQSLSSTTASNTNNKNDDTDTHKEQGEKAPAYTDHDGFLLPKGFPVESFESGLKYQAQDNDLFIVTYPKVRGIYEKYVVEVDVLILIFPVCTLCLLDALC